MANPIINEDGIFWLNSKGQRHREDGGPAVEYSNGVKEWYINDELHREDGPAIMYPNGGSKFWFIRLGVKPRHSCRGYKPDKNIYTNSNT